MNLPPAFKDTNQARWYSNFAEATGLGEQIRSSRLVQKAPFPTCASGLGAQAYSVPVPTDDFQMAFHDKNSTFTHDPPIDLWWCVNAEGTLVAIILFTWSTAMG